MTNDYHDYVYSTFANFIDPVGSSFSTDGVSHLKEQLQQHIGVPAWGHTIITNQRHLLYGDYLVQSSCPARWPDHDPDPMATPIELGSDTFKTWDDIILYFERLGGQ